MSVKLFQVTLPDSPGQDPIVAVPRHVFDEIFAGHRDLRHPNAVLTERVKNISDDRIEAGFFCLWAGANAVAKATGDRTSFVRRPAGIPWVDIPPGEWGEIVVRGPSFVLAALENLQGAILTCSGDGVLAGVPGPQDPSLRVGAAFQAYQWPDTGFSLATIWLGG